MSEPTYRIGRVANEYERIAERRAAELIDLIGVPLTYEDVVNALAIAYLDGGRDQLKWAKEKLRGDAA